MPIYEYACNACDEEIEIVHGISEKPKKKCPNCGGKLRRLISLNSFHLKGSGWYKTGYTKTDTATVKSEPGKKSGDKATPAVSKEKGEKKKAAGSSEAA